MNENRTRIRWLIAGLTLLAVCGACVGVLAYWAITEHSDVVYLLSGGEWPAWGVSLLSALVLLGLGAGRGRGILRSTPHRKLQRSVAHVQATLVRRGRNAGFDTRCRASQAAAATHGRTSAGLATRDARVS